ncbi:hypothetical protein ACFO5O_07585 [Geojedonia litorea]|uniref:YD repeat-containing protein n=1 Tax=Geojedonia litorea TaxID=1268269 RepID=A0ABV9N1K7_9FLAO
MKAVSKLFFSLSISLILTNCSKDDLPSEIETPNVQDNNTSISVTPQTPMESLASIGAVAITGYPKKIIKFSNGRIDSWAHYYFRSDGNLLKVNYGYSSTSSIFSNYYYYDNEGKIVRLEGWDEFDFYWENGRIIMVKGYNAAWHGRYDMFYDYNDQGQVIQKLVKYHDTTPISLQKLNFTYFIDGNLKSIEDYGDYNESGVFELYTTTNFDNYITSRNLFMDLEIIPGQSELHQFPGSKEFKHFTSSGYDFYETYVYKYDSSGRVIERTNGNTKIVYEYY